MLVERREAARRVWMAAGIFLVFRLLLFLGLLFSKVVFSVVLSPEVAFILNFFITAKVCSIRLSGIVAVVFTILFLCSSRLSKLLLIEESCRKRSFLGMESLWLTEIVEAEVKLWGKLVKGSVNGCLVGLTGVGEAVLVR